jgi:hypothetical protein
MFHRHKWTQWEIYSQKMKSVSKYGAYDYVEEYQQRRCTTCGLTKQKEL